MGKLAVFGANGTIGSRVVREALDRGHRVTAVVRDPSRFHEAHRRLTVVTGDVLSEESVVRAAEGEDAVVSAVGGGDGPGHRALIRPSVVSLVEGLRRLGTRAPRLIVVGGAGSLRTPDGTRVWDAPGLPDAVRQIMHAHGDALEYLRTVDDVRWTNFSPAAEIAPGDRTGRYRTGLDDLVSDTGGTSRISAEDYAVALVDEFEEPRHPQERFTAAY
ncbi:NAD(P)-dependent oxidoreductase [Streptomyces sulphureus]|uniref:NAD(P)-dependent oxidoreductase n=1 Tax=Streptomyces sulphureus TaxID=47758 RepID=UPI0003637700|nr:NAD(P)H-binding protein [Streptomyces sulphureus]